ncbi:uncharacterized protein LOC109708286 isoform X2 [Ananas comosus]|uniref:Uncharacterized protein LOC109708286 isoform X2 n=1 Tax=Ananas comosus TaxID=4615 RepID=A0A6P5EPZ9_ANACO|nr:uncharacterized protein LOC109708286 isoform X2 [Ananas comosus]
MLALFLAYFGGSSNKGLQILTILGNIQEIILQTIAADQNLCGRSSTELKVSPIYIILEQRVSALFIWTFTTYMVNGRSSLFN